MCRIFLFVLLFRGFYTACEGYLLLGFEVPQAFPGYEKRKGHRREDVTRNKVRRLGRHSQIQEGPHLYINIHILFIRIY